MAVNRNAIMLPPGAPIALQDLPRDIHFCILDCLDWQSVKAIRLTSPIFASLVSKDQLEQKHSFCNDALHKEEIALTRRLEKEYWESAEQAFLGYHSNYYYSSSHDPDLDAIARASTCSSDILPCYVCLRWLPSSTSTTKFATQSQFSRTRSTLAFDLGGKRARDRFCIACGFRRGLYVPGTIVKRSIVCLNCGKLGDPVPECTYPWAPGPNWWKGYLCGPCFRSDTVKKLTIEQYEHERLYGKYDLGLRKGKQYRTEKGQRLREERGITLVSTTTTEMVQDEVKRIEHSISKPNKGRDRHGLLPSFGDRGPNAGYCPIMRDLRFCFCSGYHPQ